MPNIIKWDHDYLQLAKFWALRKSKDPSTKVGAVIVRPDLTLVSLGYNGFPRGIKDSPERLNDRELKYELVVHAEDNALLTARESLKDCTIYTWPLPPCSRCAARIIQAGIIRVVSVHPEERWQENCTLGADILREANVNVFWYPSHINSLKNDHKISVE